MILDNNKASQYRSMIFVGLRTFPFDLYGRLEMNLLKKNILYNRVSRFILKERQI